MEELREIAKSYYNEGSTEVQAKAKLFFKSMDVDRDGRVSLEEFLAFMRHQGYTHMRNNSFFRLLDCHGNGSLGFTDVMTLYYIIKSGRPFCDCCGKFIAGVFFSCVPCYNASRRFSFNICHPCHKSRTSRHSHDGRRAFFLDNYTLLQAITTTTNGTVTTTLRRPSQLLASASTSTQYSATSFMQNELNRVLAQSRPTPSSTTVVHRSVTMPSTSNTHRVYSNAVVSASSLNGMKLAEFAFKALDGVLVLGNVFTTLGAACTIL